MHNQIKRKLGIALFIFGLTIIGGLLAMFLWIVVDAFYRTGDLSFLSRKDFYYSLPLFLFLLPGIYLTSAGRRMSQGEELSRLSYVEISLMLIIGIGLIYLNLQADSDYAERANQKQNGHWPVIQYPQNKLSTSRFGGSSLLGYRTKTKMLDCSSPTVNS